MENTTTPQESSKLPPPKWISTATATIVGLLLLAILQSCGDSVFDWLQQSLGKKLVVESISLLLVLLGYISWRFYSKPRVRKLHRRRAVYWATRDKTPFCPRCYEVDSKQHHLTSQTIDSQSKNPQWICFACYYGYEDVPDSDFRMIETYAALARR